jgi:SAM-dependent methyltransferase
MKPHAWYEEWFNSPFYHKLYFEHDEKEAEAFIHRLLDHIKPTPASRMLDVACGKGRHSRILADLGYDVTGIDLSPSSIRFAKQFENEHLEFFIHDMRLPFRSNYFNIAFNFFTSFGYFPTRREHDNAVRTVVSSLQPGGLFVIDYLNAHYSEDHLSHTEVKQLGLTTYSIQRWDDEDHFFKKITINDPVLAVPEEYTEVVAKFSLGDFTDMLSDQGCQVREVFGDYQLNPYAVRTTPRLIIIAEKVKRGSSGKREG